VHLEMALHFLGKLALVGYLAEESGHPEEPCA
jgi:hypothetical protein